MIGERQARSRCYQTAGISSGVAAGFRDGGGNVAEGCAMSSEGWKVDHNDHGTLEGSHQHDRGDPIIATLELADDGTRYFLCDGGEVVIDRDTRSEAARIRPCQG